MDFDTKTAHRKSKAPWNLPGNNKTFSSTNGTKHEDISDYPSNHENNKRTRRMSIHASASAAAHTKNMINAGNMPPVPQLPEMPTLEVAEKPKSMKELATNGGASEIDDYYNFLLKEKVKLDTNIKSNINKNQKNILELMTDLKETQNELVHLRTSTKSLIEVLDEFKDSASRRLSLEDKNQEQGPYLKQGGRKDRSSILVLEKMWVTELQSLYKHVEGASKFIQTAPGRHLLVESGRWFEVNLGNWKPTKAIHIFVLNDLILIATKKSSNAIAKNPDNKSRLQAIHCWPLHELNLQILDGQNDDTNKTYLIQISSKTLKYIYQTDRYDHFVKITDAFKKGKNELLQKDRLYDVSSINEEFETDDEKRQLRESLRNSGVFEEENNKRRSGSHRHSADILLQDISARVHSRNRSHDFSSNGKFSQFTKADKGQFFNELKRVEDRLDEVDVEIAHDKFHEAVGLINYIEKKMLDIERIINKTNTNDNETLASIEEIKLLIDVIKLKISNRKLEVQHSLTFNLQNNISRLRTEELGAILEFFYSFDALEKGISTYLRATSNNLTNIISKLVVNVQGSTKADVSNYVSNLVIIYVAFMKRTIRNYQQCIFPILERDSEGTVNSSGLVNWCIEEGNKLIKSIKKQLLGTLLIREDPDDDNNSKLLIKDPILFKSFISILVPQLDDLKSVGINIEYLFNDILHATTIN